VFEQKVANVFMTVMSCIVQSSLTVTVLSIDISSVINLTLISRTAFSKALQNWKIFVNAYRNDYAIITIIMK
jgi:hypothetical protein